MSILPPALVALSFALSAAAQTEFRTATSGITAGAIAGIVIGGVVGVLLLCLCLYLLRRLHARDHSSGPTMIGGGRGGFYYGGAGPAMQGVGMASARPGPGWTPDATQPAFYGGQQYQPSQGPPPGAPDSCAAPPAAPPAAYTGNC